MIIGDVVKLKSLTTLLKYFEQGRLNLRGSSFEKTIAQKWYDPIQRNYDVLSKETFILESIVLHPIMGKCWYINNDNGTCRLPEQWIIKI